MSLPVAGHCQPQFDVLADLLAGSIEAGNDLGASVAVMVGDEMVVDLWGGWIDEEQTIPWEADTITNVWSTTKTMTSLTALVLVERGLLDVGAPVAQYWPEFAAAGKEDIEVRHLLSHTSGLAAWRQPVRVDDILDWDGAIARLEQQEPWWTPGTASGYHALTQGHLVGEVVRRITGQSLGRYFAAEIAEPLGADFHIGLDASHDSRVAPVVAPIEMPATEPDQPLAPWLAEVGPIIDATVAWRPEWRRAEIGAANGHGNARSVARIQSVVANNGTTRSADGTEVTLLSPATIDTIFRQQAYGTDLLLGDVKRFGVGYGLPSPEDTPFLPEPHDTARIAFWGGWGGSAIIADVDRSLTIAYMMNRMIPGEAGDDRAEAIVRATYALIDS